MVLTLPLPAKDKVKVPVRVGNKVEITLPETETVLDNEEEKV